MTTTSDQVRATTPGEPQLISLTEAPIWEVWWNR
jgi:hypothetical protein